MRGSLTFVFVVTMLWLILHSAMGCRGGGGSNAEASLDLQDAPGEEPTDSQREDEQDETSEDISLDDEDFDLVCEGYVSPNRVQRLPSVIIIGAKKGGTRALLEFMKLHPLLKAAGPEIHFFDTQYDKGLEWYISKMPPTLEGQLGMEKTPGYFHTPKAPRRIRAMDPNIKLLLIVRDPVKRLVSDYNQFLQKNLKAGSDYPPLEELLFTPNGSLNMRYPALQRSIYHVHMARWYKQFPKSNIHIVDGDNFIKAPWAELAQVESFLNVQPVITEQNFFFNSTKGFYCAREVRTKGVWSCQKDKCLSKAKGRPKPKIVQTTLDKLTDFFRPHNAKFYELVNQTFSWPI